MAYVDPQVTTSDDNDLSVEQYIRQQAIARGMDPDTAVGVGNSEALRVFDPTKPDLGGDEGSSFGPFQLHYAGLSKTMPHAGLGDEFTKQTGLSARDPSTWKQQVDFSLDYAKQHGWGSWMGAKNTGIGEWQGIRDDASIPSANNSLSIPTSGEGNGSGSSTANPVPGPAGNAPSLMTPQMKKLMALTWLQSSLAGVKLQRVDYDPFAIISK